LDAIVLREIFRWKQEHHDRQILPPGNRNYDEQNPSQAQRWPNIGVLVETLEISEEDTVLALENLERLGLIVDFVPSTEWDALTVGDAGIYIPGQPVPVWDERAMLDMSHTGMALMAACSP
jgi:hypothetical protein